MPADMAVFDRDILTVEPEEIATTNVLRTIRGGETTYEA
jgi:predicted amidohydrolase YtcJ